MKGPPNTIFFFLENSHSLMGTCTAIRLHISRQFAINVTSNYFVMLKQMTCLNQHFYIGSVKYLFFWFTKNYWIFSQISLFYLKVQSFRIIMENNFIEMANSAGHVEPTWSIQFLSTLSIVCSCILLMALRILSSKYWIMSGWSA